MEFITYILAHLTDIIAALLQIIGGFALLAKITPTTVDDDIINFLLKIVNLGSLNIKKAAKVEATAEIVNAGITTAKEAAEVVTGVNTAQVTKATE